MVIAQTQKYIRYQCRKCKKITEQIERVVTDNLPPHLKTLQCVVCGAMGVCFVGDQS